MGRRRLASGITAFAIAGALVVGCGGDDSTGIVADGGGDAGADTTAQNDTGGDTTLDDAPPDTNPGDTGTDANGKDASDGGGDAPSDSPSDALADAADSGPVDAGCPADGGACNCDAVAGNTFYVDPVNGSDTQGNGSGKSGGQAAAVCAFKTVARAITAVNAITGGPPAGTKIFVSGPNTTAATEAFPWIVPVNTALASQGGAVTANVPAATDGVRLRFINSSVAGFVLDGTAHTAALGIVVQNTATANTVSIAGVTVRDFLEAGIRVEGAAGVTIGAGTRSTNNGLNANGQHRSGLRITDTGQVLINNPNGDAITFDQNSAYGIELDAQGKIDVTGTPGQTIGTGTVVVSGNFWGGVSVGTTSSALGTPPLSTFTGIVAYNNITGALILGGTQVKVRGSRFYTNGVGITITSASIGATPDDLSGIDLGKNVVADPGKNVLQSPLNQGQNGSVGLCFDILPNKSQTLNAFGNTWMGTLAATTAQYDCSTTAAALTKPNTTSCAGGGGTSVSGKGQTGNVMGVALCTP